MSDTSKNENSLHSNTNEAAFIPFWTEDPNILFKQQYLLEFFPTDNMTYEQKMNAISRLVIILTIVGFLFSQNVRLLIVAGITLTVIYLLFMYQKTEDMKKNSKKVTLDKNSHEMCNKCKNGKCKCKPGECNCEPGECKCSTMENFESGPATGTLMQMNIPLDTAKVFDAPSSGNPFSNVLMTDYDYNPNKKPAAPSYNNKVNNDILGQAKQLVQNANPDQPDIADKLFNSLGDQLFFEQSLRQFNSNPSTTIPNDQGAFADFCYSGMVSAKEGNMFALARNLSRYEN